MKTKQFMALLKKDLLIYKNILLLPIWITLGFYLINLVSFAFAYFRGDISHFIHFSEGDFSFAINNVNNPIISYIANYGAVLVPAVLSGIVLIYLAQKAMNEDKNLQFSFFHRSQPVDESLIIASKSVIIIVGLWLTTAVLSLLNFTIVNIVLHTKLHLFHSQGMIGFFQSLFLVLLSFFFVGSSLILCSSIFKKAAFMKLFSVLILIKFLFGIFEYLYRW
ncbi:MAG: hypothetical protein U9N34_08825, partial [Candidatus Cloacimonadota bacterium]|nr:hypothetical protein [Candidatus Cloacimonadota bacterium]